MITYEYPLNERIRTLLRLEDLYDKSLTFSARADSRDHHVALVTLFEILEVAGRADLKSDLLQELDRQKHTLEILRHNPAISEAALETVLTEIDRIYSSLITLSGKTGQHLRDNEWLMSIKQRTNIPGGACEFDLPSYHHWLHQDPETRRHDLAQWLNPMLPLADALRLVLKLLRESARPMSLVAARGMFQQMPAGKLAQMLRLVLTRDLPCVPEISANKYALNIRFIAADKIQRPKPVDQDVEFELTFCNL
ncbi:MAG: cell division protein ZapD [Burkholderiales bacterium]|nr:cell division protein ZapD [Burkholderiales bacterium]